MTPTGGRSIESYRRDVKWIRNLQEGRHALARKGAQEIFEALGVAALPTNATASSAAPGALLGPRDGDYELTVDASASVLTASVRATIAIGGRRTVAVSSWL